MDRRLEKKRWTPKTIAVLAVSVVVVVVLVVVAVHPRESSLRTDSDRITISTVVHGSFQEFISISGTVIPIDNLFLDAVEGGRVEEIYLEAGSMVTEGDPILKLSNTNLLLDIMWREAELFQQSNNLRNTWLLMEQSRLQLRRELAEIENHLRQQHRTYDRYVELATHDLLPRHELELAKDEFDSLTQQRNLTVETQGKYLEFREAQLDALETSLERMGNNLDVVKQKQDNLTIRAPVSGHLTALDAEVGQLKTSGERLGQIDILRGFKVRAAVDELYITRVEQERAGQFELDGVTYPVVVRKVYPEVQDGRFEIDLGFPVDTPVGIRRGQRLRVRLELSEESEALLLSRGSFFQATGGSWAYVVDHDGGSAVRKRIRLGRQNPEVYEVLEGLDAQDRVITSSYEGYGDTDRLMLN